MKLRGWLNCNLKLRGWVKNVNHDPFDTAAFEFRMIGYKEGIKKQDQSLNEAIAKIKKELQEELEKEVTSSRRADNLDDPKKAGTIDENSQKKAEEDFKKATQDKQSAKKKLDDAEAHKNKIEEELMNKI